MIELEDYATAREVLMSMSESARRDPLSQYLIFKIAIRSDQCDIAADCLQNIAASSTDGFDHLFACVLEAQEKGHKYMTIAAMQIILQRVDYFESNGVNVPCLIRCIIRMLEGLLKGGQIRPGSDEYANSADNLCELFEKSTMCLPFSISYH